MKALIIAVTLTGLAVASPLAAQGRSRTPVNSRNRQDCTYAQTTNSVGDIIFGRSGVNTTNCRDDRSTRVNGAWYPVGRDGNGNTIYERRTRDAKGNVIVQRARRDTFGNMTIISNRNAGNNGRWNNNRQRGDNDDQNGTWNNNRRRGHDDDDQGDNDGDNGNYGDNNNNGNFGDNNGNNDNGNFGDNNGNNDNDAGRGQLSRRDNSDNRYNNNDYRYGNSEHKRHGQGKGHKGRD